MAKSPGTGSASATPAGAPAGAPIAFDVNTQSDNDGSRAGQACASCRRQKRKCDKLLPGCSLCVKMNRPCDYVSPAVQSNNGDLLVLHDQIQKLEATISNMQNENIGSNLAQSATYMPAAMLSAVNSGGQQYQQSYTPQDPAFSNIQNHFPAIAFLDTEAYKHGDLPVTNTSVDVPCEVLDILGDGVAVIAVLNDYFSTIHQWLPIVSKKRIEMERDARDPLYEAGPDLVLLFISMKLMTVKLRDDSEAPQSYMYLATKRFLSLMEYSGMISLYVLQSYVLVSMYELSHAIYPGAWMTSGAAVRYGLLLGTNAHKAVPALLGPDTSVAWVEQEERKRTWWAVMIVDRVVTAGSQGRIFASEDPDANTTLPCDTSSWDEGHMAESPLLGTSGSYSEPRDAFARLCQSSILLGKVIRHHYMPLTPKAYQFQHASELYREISELVRILSREALNSTEYLLRTPGLAVCLSALSILCDPYACINYHAREEHESISVEESTMQIQATEGVKDVSSSVKDMSIRIQEHAVQVRARDLCNPMVLDSLYAAAANFAWFARDSGEQESMDSLEQLRACLRLLGSRWRVASEYARALEMQEHAFGAGLPGLSAS